MNMNNSDIVEGGIYSIDEGKGKFRITKVLVIDESAVHVRVYKGEFDERPQSVDTSTLTLGSMSDPDGFGVGHLPLLMNIFLDWIPVHLVTEQVWEEELVGYRYYIEAMKQ